MAWIKWIVRNFYYYDINDFVWLLLKSILNKSRSRQSFLSQQEVGCDTSCRDFAGSKTNCWRKYRSFLKIRLFLASSNDYIWWMFEIWMLQEIYFKYSMNFHWLYYLNKANNPVRIRFGLVCREYFFVGISWEGRNKIIVLGHFKYRIRP